MPLSLSEHIRNIPVLRPFIFYLTGLTGRELTSVPGNSLLIFLILLNIIFFSKIIAKDQRIRKNINAIGFLLLFMLAGLLSGYLHKARDPQESLEGIVLAEVLDYPEEKERSWFVPCRILFSVDSSFVPDAPIHANLYFGKEAFPADSILPGKRLILHARLNRIRNAGNPDEFDYASFLERRDIFYTGYFQQGDWIFAGSQRSSPVYIALRIRKFIEKRIMACAGDFHAEIPTILVAIGLGDRSMVSDETRDQFSRAGAIHVMAVSGLHVGLIWMFLGYITAVAGRTLVARIFRFILVTFLIWGYALLTGLSPSVTRASLMFTIMGLGKLLSRNSSGLNNVVISCFIQVVINPGVLEELGFQFSYAAVFSILLFQPVFKTVLPAAKGLIRYFSELVTVSLSAQILTLPLTLYYFHSFPSFFLLTNIIIIPLVTLLMILFLCSCIMIFHPSVFSFLMNMDLELTGIMHRMVEWIGDLPGSTINNVVITVPQAFILLILPLFFLAFKTYKKISLLRMMIILPVIFMHSGYLYSMHNRDPELVIFNIPGSCAVSFFTGDQLIFLYEGGTDPELVRYHCGNYWIKNYRQEPDFLDISDSASLDRLPHCNRLPGTSNLIFHTGNSKIILLSDYKALNTCEFNRNIEADVLILNRRELWDYHSNDYRIQAQTIILTSALKNVPEKYLELFATCDSTHITTSSGAYIHMFTKNAVKKSSGIWLFSR